MQCFGDMYTNKGGAKVPFGDFDIGPKLSQVCSYIVHEFLKRLHFFRGAAKCFCKVNTFGFY